VRAPYPVLVALADGTGPFAKAMLRAMMGGRARVGGVVRHAPRLMALVLAMLRRG
jgi:hypothetical protein